MLLILDILLKLDNFPTHDILHILDSLLIFVILHILEKDNFLLFDQKKIDTIESWCKAVLPVSNVNNEHRF